MTENIYAIWKCRFPILRNMRCHLPTAKKIIIATGILHNLSIRLQDGLPDEANDIAAEGLDDLQEDPVVAHGGAGGVAMRRARGQEVRENLLRNLIARRPLVQ